MSRKVIISGFYADLEDVEAIEQIAKDEKRALASVLNEAIKMLLNERDK